MPIPTLDLLDVTIRTGGLSVRDSDICVIVMSVHSDPSTACAVQSILDQNVPVEIIVVNTGEGSLANIMDKGLLDRVTLIETPSQQYAGGARNLGIRHSSAPIVSFLAADCAAGPEWINRRLSAHRAGNKTVASALRPTADRFGNISVASWISYIFIHFHRMPESNSPASAMFGLSYDRGVFHTIGLFDEQVRVSEDHLFNQLCAKVSVPYWDPKVITLHKYPGTIRESLLDQLHRGRRAAKFMNRNANQSAIKHVCVRAWRVLKIVAESFRPSRIPPECGRGKLPFLLPLFLFYAYGALSR